MASPKISGSPEPGFNVTTSPKEVPEKVSESSLQGRKIKKRKQKSSNSYSLNQQISNVGDTLSRPAKMLKKERVKKKDGGKKIKRKTKQHGVPGKDVTVSSEPSDKLSSLSKTVLLRQSKSDSSSSSPFRGFDPPPLFQGLESSFGRGLPTFSEGPSIMEDDADSRKLSLGSLGEKEERSIRGKEERVSSKEELQPYKLFSSPTVPDILDSPLAIEGEVSSELTEIILSLAPTYRSAADLELSWNESPLGTLFTTEIELEEMVTKRMELYKGDPSIKDKLREHCKEYVASLTVGEYVRNVFIPLLNAGACGNTTNILEGFVSRSDPELIPKKEASNSRALAMIITLKVGLNSNGHWYCRVDAGPHSFLIEYNKKKLTLHQSYFGSYPFVDNLQNNRVFSVEDFAKLIELAGAPNPFNPTRTGFEVISNRPSVVSARRALFASQSFRPNFPDGLNFRFIEPAIPSTIKERIEAQAERGSKIWSEMESTPMSTLITFSAEPETPKIVVLPEGASSEITSPEVALSGIAPPGVVHAEGIAPLAEVAPPPTEVPQATVTYQPNQIAVATLRQLLTPNANGVTKIMDEDSEVMLTSLDELIEGEKYVMTSPAYGTYKLLEKGLDQYIFQRE